VELPAVKKLGEEFKMESLDLDVEPCLWMKLGWYYLLVRCEPQQMSLHMRVKRTGGGWEVQLQEYAAPSFVSSSKRPYPSHDVGLPRSLKGANSMNPSLYIFDTLFLMIW